MAGRLEVDLAGLAGLEEFATRMDAIRSALESSQGYLGGFGADLGDPQVVAAVGHFNGNWSDGRKHVRHSLLRSVEPFYDRDDPGRGPSGSG